MSIVEQDGEILPSHRPDGNGNHPRYKNVHEETPHDFSDLSAIDVPQSDDTAQEQSDVETERQQPEWHLSETDKQIGRVGVAGARQALQEARRRKVKKS